MRRGKPEREIYRPGSGLLRKSKYDDESESNTNYTNYRDKQNMPQYDMRYKDDWGAMAVETESSLRKTRKPEQSFYVPRPLANVRDMSKDDEHQYSTSHTNGNFDNERCIGRSKRYSNRRLTGADNPECQDEWREKSASRQFRQGSEPRGLSNGSHMQRMRDTKSVEPIGPTCKRGLGEKPHSKPPSGRRHSTIGLEPEKRPHKPMNIDKLPPRFRKKFLEENKLHSNQNIAEDNWNGSSMTFQGSNNFHQAGSYSTIPGHQSNYYSQPYNNMGYSTLPNRSRGRGRFTRDPDSSFAFRSTTPDLSASSPCNSRPPTPVQNTSRHNEKYNYKDSHQSSPVNYRPKQHENTRASAHSPVDYHSKHHENMRDNTQSPVDYHSKHYENPRANTQSPVNYQSKHPENTKTRTQSPGKFNSKHQEDTRTHMQSSVNSQPKHHETTRNKRERNHRKNHLNRNRDYTNTPVDKEENWDHDFEKESSCNNFSVPEEKATKFVMPPAQENTCSSSTNPVVDGNTAILDWSEEVELELEAEAEAQSDAMTRSSSVTSLTETNINSLASNSNTMPKKKRRNCRKNRRGNGSSARDSSIDTKCRNGSRQQNDDLFKVPQELRGRRRRPSRDRYESSNDRRSQNPSRESSFDRSRRYSNGDHENWRDEIVRSRQNSERETGSERSRCNSERDSDKINVKKGGVIILPSKQPETPKQIDHPKYPEIRKPSQQKILFDHHNPNKPIIVKSQSSRVTVPGFSEDTETSPPQIYTTDQFGNIRPGWYDEASDGFKSCRYPKLVNDIKRADCDLQFIMNSGLILINWGTVELLREFLKEAMKYLLCKDLKFCQTENVEQHLWKILYHNIIEATRKAIVSDADNKEQYKGFLLYLIDEGTCYFEDLLSCLEETYKFKLNTYLSSSSSPHQKGSGFVGLALISAQKLFLFLGDLGRYREQVNESSNYGKCRQWYIKAHEINPKNGRPYNQLAVLAVYARRKLDAVYYYMRSLMSSNPVPSAREYLVSLFDENRKKYEQSERKRREERIEKAKQYMKQKESDSSENIPGSLRHETWIRPDGGKRVHRTTQAIQEQKDSEEEDLAALSSVEVNKRFVISYLHVHGKLITRIGMESFHEAAVQMLKEFRALLQHSPVPLPCNRFLQLLALNMFAIESTQLKDPQQLQAGYRSELQERALVISLQMFNLILERCVALLQENGSNQVQSLPQDVLVLLPAVKIWCDWMLCHSAVWNPPPSTQDFKVGTSGDAWTRLATLMNLLEKLDQSSSSLVPEYQEGYEPVKLPEDIILNGFTPLMVNDPDIQYVPKDVDIEYAQFCLRMRKLLFFGTVFLCGLEPPVLKLEIEDDFREYVSVVSTSNSRNSPLPCQELNPNDDVLMESFSDEDQEVDVAQGKVEDASSEVRHLLSRKVELERTHRRQQLHKQRVKKILSQAVVTVHIEVRPKYLVPDTNCFIDHLQRIVIITASHVYTLMVPIIVLSELEGLSRGGKSPVPSTRTALDPHHVLKVAQAAKEALVFLKNRPQAVKCITTKGAILSSTTFTTEDDSAMDANFKNDDKILSTCLVLNKVQQEQAAEGGPKKLISEVVLLTDDRNLRVKALASDVPVRELVDFMQWAGLG